MKTSTLFLVLLSFISYVAAACDTSATNCNTCINGFETAGCGWCSATAECKEGTKEGPTDGTCLGEFWEFTSCTKCEEKRNCRDCLSRSGDCSWCENLQKCFDTGAHPNGCARTTECSCDSYVSCDSCSLTPGCSWCRSSGSCVTQSQLGDCQLISHSCNCDEISTCDLCQESVSGCEWCEDTGKCQVRGASNCPTNTTSCPGYCDLRGSGDCNKCINTPGCAYCQADGSCQDSLIPHKCSQPLTNTCLNCQEHRYCGTCTDTEGCSWCSDTKKCHELHEASCLNVLNCDAFCESAKDCSSCNAISGCGWCSKDKKCLESSLPGKCKDDAWDFVCNNSHCGFDGGSFAGGMFLIIGLLLIGVGGFFGYRYWQNRQNPSYTELK